MKFDVLVVTASNEAQARGYRAMVAPLVGALAEKILVVPDPGGKRVGSLGSTVGVLKAATRSDSPRMLRSAKRLSLCPIAAAGPFPSSSALSRTWNG